MKKLKLYAAAGSNCGRAKGNNNSFYFDSFFPEADQIQYPMLVQSTHTDRNINLFGVFDGLGNCEYSGYASYTAALSMKNCHDSLFCEQSPYWDGMVNDYIRQLNEQIDDINKQYKCSVGVDMAILGFDGQHIHVYGSQSCSVFMLRDGKLSRLTADFSHSSDGHLGSDEHNQSAYDSVYPVSCISKIEPQKDDIYLLCTSGIDSVLDSDSIKDILTQNSDDKQLVNSLIESAIDNGADGNITAIVTRIAIDPSSLFMGTKKGSTLISCLISLAIVLALAFSAYGIYLYGSMYDSDLPIYSFFAGDDQSASNESQSDTAVMLYDHLT